MRIFESVVLALGFVLPAQQRSDALRVMVWNIQRGANQFERGPEKALQVIRDAKPDICLLQESYDIEGDRPMLGAWLAGQLKWQQWQGKSTHLCVLTHLKIDKTRFHAAWHGVGAEIVDAQGRRLVVYSTWIDYREYTPYHLRDHPTASDAELLACEQEKSNRLRQTKALLKHLDDSGAMARDVPLLVGGDWNCPSHLDWTNQTERVFQYRRALPLPVSIAMRDAGFVDVFRAVHPDPLKAPGLTWSPLYRGTLEKPVPSDRIDRLYSLPARAGWQLQPIAAQVLPRLPEDENVADEQRAFPSDHGAVVLDLKWHRDR